MMAGLDRSVQEHYDLHWDSKGHSSVTTSAATHNILKYIAFSSSQESKTDIDSNDAEGDLQYCGSSA
jgi:hypothetical protein